MKTNNNLVIILAEAKDAAPESGNLNYLADDRLLFAHLSSYPRQLHIRYRYLFYPQSFSNSALFKQQRIRL